MWELDSKELRVLKNWCFWTVVLEKTHERPLESNEIKSVNLETIPEYIRRNDAEAEAPILWPPDTQSWLTGKDPDGGKDWKQKEKRVTEDEIVGWYHWFIGHEPGQTKGDGKGQRSLACCSPWGHKELDRIWWLNNYNNIREYIITKRKISGTSLVVQWLITHLPLQRTWVWPLIQEDSTCLRATTETTSHKNWSLHALRTCVLQKRSHWIEKFIHHN